MNKRTLSLLLLMVGVLLFSLYLYDVTRHPRVRQTDFAALVPSHPLLYLQCTGLRTRLQQVTGSPEYRRFLQSDIGQQWQNAWSARFILPGQNLWNSLLLDPMRILGTDIALSVYPARADDHLPSVIVLGKFDWVARIAERIVRLFDRVTGQVGITFMQDFHGIRIYQVHRQEMFVPVYYAMLDEIGVASTSLLLLQHTLLAAIGTPDRFVVPPPFRTITQEIPEQRVLTWYAALAPLLKELHPYVSVRNEGANLPVMFLRLDAVADRLTLHAEFFSEVDISTSFQRDQEEERVAANFFRTIPDQLPIVAAVDRDHLRRFLQHGQQLFPQWDWTCPMQIVDQMQAFGNNTGECRMSKTVAGMLYAVPEITCILDAHDPEQFREWLTTSVVKSLTQISSSPVQQVLVKMSDEPYQDVVISQLRFAFQNVLNYTVVRNRQDASQPAYLVIGTTLKELKHQINVLQERPDTQPYLLRFDADSPAFIGWLNNDRLADLIRDLSTTSTFALLFPPAQYPQTHRLLPYLTSVLKFLPPVLIASGRNERGLYLNLDMYRSGRS